MLVRKTIPAPQKPKLKKPKNKVLPNHGAECPLGSKADMCSAPAHVRFGPKTDIETGPGQARIVILTQMTAFKRTGFGKRFNHVIDEGADSAGHVAPAQIDRMDQLEVGRVERFE